MKVVITANGQGSRMKCLSPFPKHELYYGDKKIIDHLLAVYPEAEVLTGFPSASRRETLERIRDYTDCLIIDCDIVLPYRLAFSNTDNDVVFYFKSDKDKYSSIGIDENGLVAQMSETKNISRNKCSGVYFVKSVDRLLKWMHLGEDNSIVMALGNAVAVREDYIIKLGDPSDYYEALGIKLGWFTGNRIMMNEKTVIKYCKSGEQEQSWYEMATMFNVPEVMYADEEMIITERIYPTEKPTAEDFIRIIKTMQSKTNITNVIPFSSYINNLPHYHYWNADITLKEHPGTFFHGDLSTTNVLKNSRVWLIDPNVRNVFGSWLTDAGKAAFSFIAYEQDYPSAARIADEFGEDVWAFAVAEGLRVTKYKPEYISIVNNIRELCQ